MCCSYKVAVCQAAVCRIVEYMWICGMLLLSGEDQWLAMTGLSWAREHMQWIQCFSGKRRPVKQSSAAIQRKIAHVGLSLLCSNYCISYSILDFYCYILFLCKSCYYAHPPTGVHLSPLFQHNAQMLLACHSHIMLSIINTSLYTC